MHIISAQMKTASLAAGRSHPLFSGLHAMLDPAVTGPAIARRRQRDVVLDQAILEDGDALGVLALLALVLGRRGLRPDLNTTVLAILVAQSLAVSRRVTEDADAHHAGLLAVTDLDYDAAVLRLAYTVPGLHHGLVLAPANDGDGGGRH